MIAIPITNETLDFIEELNSGVRPFLETGGSIFLYKGKDETPEIIGRDELPELVTKNPGWTIHHVFVHNQ